MSVTPKASSGALTSRHSDGVGKTLPWKLLQTQGDLTSPILIVLMSMVLRVLAVWQATASATLRPKDGATSFYSLGVVPGA